MGDETGRPPETPSDKHARSSLTDLPTSALAEMPLPTVTPTASSSRFVPGTVIGGRFRIVAPLGRGGMGEVFRADDLRLGHAVALKFLPAAVAHDASRLAWLTREVSLARQITHPSVCRVFDLMEMDGQQFVAMEYVDGEDLAALMRRIGRLPVPKALELALQIVRGLVAVHEHRVLHRDLKAENVMLDGRGQVRLMDFGIALSLQGVEDRELLQGTPAYLAPELIRGDAVTVQSDLYALGVTLYELFTGRRPFVRASVDDLQRAHAEDAPEPPSRLAPEIDPAVEAVVLACLSKDPAERPRSARAVAAALPGGDTLSRALAAGATPAPEVVAAAEPHGALAPRWVGAVLMVTLAALSAYAALSARSTLLGLLSPPAALAVRAREMVHAVGWTLGDAETGPPELSIEWRRFREIAQRDRSASRWQALRQDPVPLRLRWEWRTSGGTSGVVETGAGRPRPETAAVTLDSSGHLVRLEITPPSTVPHVAPGPPDWGELLNLTGLDPATLTQTAPLWTPHAFADTRAAWLGRTKDGSEVRVEAAALGRHVVSLVVKYSWSASDPPSVPLRLLLGTIGRGVIVLVPAALGLLLARRNLRTGRGDRLGARRLATAVFVAGLAQRLLAGEELWSVTIGAAQARGLAQALLEAALTWILYMAAEPIVRRRSPATLVSWTRLLSGKWRDPLVGRDLLAGVAVGSVVTTVLALLHVSRPLGLMAPMAPFIPVAAFFSPNLLAARLVEDAVGSVLLGLSGLVGVVVLRSLLRSEAAAIVVVLTLVLLPNLVGTVNPPLIVFALHVALLWAPVTFLIRRGLLAFCVCYFTLTVLTGLVGASDWWSWAGAHSLAVLGLLAGLALGGASLALGGRVRID